MIKILIKGDPPRATSQEKGCVIVYRNGEPKPMFYTKKKVIDAKWYFAKELLKHRQEHKLTGAVNLNVRFVFSTNNKAKWGKPKTTRPDTDNLVKGLKDVLTDLMFWNDDAQVWSEHVTKEWGETGYTEIEIVETGG